MTSFIYNDAVAMDVIEVPAAGSGVYQFLIDGAAAEDLGYGYDELYTAAQQAGAFSRAIRVILNPDAVSYSETDADMVWVKTSYTEPVEGYDDCAACEQPIEDMDHWLCLDGGEAAHPGCVVVVPE